MDKLSLIHLIGQYDTLDQQAAKPKSEVAALLLVEGCCNRSATTIEPLENLEAAWKSLQVEVCPQT